MERHAIQKHLGSYTIDKRMVESLTTFFSQILPHSLSPDLAGVHMEENVTITVVYAGEGIRFSSLAAFKSYPFSQHIESILIQLSRLVKTGNYEKAIVLELAFGKEVDDNFMSLALQDNYARTKLNTITQQLLGTLRPHRNDHSRYYRSELLHTAFFIAGSIFGTLAFAVQDTTFAIILGLVGVSALGLFFYITINGYSSFKLDERPHSWLHLS